MKKQQSLLVSVTYKCNASCPYCYIGEFRKKFPKDMSLFVFLDIVNHFIKAGGRKILLIGGEPALWKHVNRAIRYCHLRGVPIMIFTNGLEAVKADPDEVYVNLAYYFTKQDKVLKTLKDYKGRGVDIILRYNMTAAQAEAKENQTKEVAEKIAKLALDFGSVVHVTPVSPFSLCREVGRNLYEFIEIVRSHGVKCSIPDPIPPCVFDEKEREYLKKHCKLYHKCGLGYLPLIHPDGETVQPCSRMFFPKSINNLSNILQAKELYAGKTEELENDVPPSCRECDYFKRKECCGGCMVSRFEKNKDKFM